MPLPWSFRKSKWDPPSLLESLLQSPLAVIVGFIHSIFLYLRGASFHPPKNRPPIRVVCISDTHSHQPSNIPPGDLLLHSGDLTNDGTIKSIQESLNWLNTLPHKYKVVIAGNHDSYFDPSARKDEDINSKTRLNWGSIIYLHNRSTHLRFKGGRSLNIYGSPDIPRCGDKSHAFQYDPTTPPWTSRIPLSTDILITHTPPHTHLDLSLGCPGLLSEIWRVKPRIHVFGHIHSGHGRETLFWDGGQAAYERIVAHQSGVWGDLVPGRKWVDAWEVVWYGVKGVLWQWLMMGPKGGNGGLLVNAALTYQSTSDIGNEPQVVVL
ncbi:hypothetical protein V496_06604 [Pseudogymnoascus sp. VKM F-4515 (FW-2607)]|nr:hypothetical protein V496_06604 [Pseudogymnoascus sp. VKM F-4515 (FW-2607)]